MSAPPPGFEPNYATSIPDNHFLKLLENINPNQIIDKNKNDVTQLYSMLLPILNENKEFRDLMVQGLKGQAAPAEIQPDSTSVPIENRPPGISAAAAGVSVQNSNPPLPPRNCWSQISHTQKPLNQILSDRSNSSSDTLKNLFSKTSSTNNSETKSATATQNTQNPDITPSIFNTQTPIKSEASKSKNNFHNNHPLQNQHVPMAMASPTNTSDSASSSCSTSTSQNLNSHSLAQQQLLLNSEINTTIRLIERLDLKLIVNPCNLEIPKLAKYFIIKDLFWMYVNRMGIL